MFFDLRVSIFSEANSFLDLFDKYLFDEVDEE